MSPEATARDRNRKDCDGKGRASKVLGGNVKCLWPLVVWAREGSDIKIDLSPFYQVSDFGLNVIVSS